MTDTKSLEENNIQVGLAENVLTNLKNKAKNRANNEIVNIVEKILEFNRQQLGGGLKILKKGQILSRLPIFLA